MLGSQDARAGPDRLDATSFVSSTDLDAAIAELNQTSAAAVRIRVASGTGRFEMSLTDHRSTAGVDGFVASFRSLEHEEALDATLALHRQHAEHLLSALTDDLTGLPTRRLFLDRLGDRLRGRPAEHEVSVFMIDLDGFKDINDALGHTAGDAMLRSTAERLLAIVPDIEQWGRVAGDEFVLFVERCGRRRAEAIAQSIASALRQAIVLGGRTLHTSASIGLMIVNEVLDAQTALRRADIAMHEGKRNGPDRTTVFTAEMESHVIIRAELEGQLRSTLTGSGPDVVFQPIVDLQSGRTIAVEALARWHSPTQGPIGPDRFVSMVESMGLIGQLDRHVLRKACRAIADRCEPTSGWPLDLSVNSSAMSLSRPDDADRILKVLDDERFAPHRLILEITESLAIENDDVVRSQLQKLRGRASASRSTTSAPVTRRSLSSRPCPSISSRWTAVSSTTFPRRSAACATSRRSSRWRPRSDWK
jgi:diguanylate cyclase (GGDEF)-like protein